MLAHPCGCVKWLVRELAQGIENALGGFGDSLQALGHGEDCLGVGPFYLQRQEIHEAQKQIAESNGNITISTGPSWTRLNANLTTQSSPPCSAPRKIKYVQSA